MDCAKFHLGLARLERANAAPLCLYISTDGEWGFYKTVALAGHPNPGNARRGHSHPTDINAFRESDYRGLGKIPGLPFAATAAQAIGEQIGAALWPGEWSVWVSQRTDDGTVTAIDICRKVSRDRSAPALVALALQGLSHKASMDMMMRGGRP